MRAHPVRAFLLPCLLAAFLAAGCGGEEETGGEQTSGKGAFSKSLMVEATGYNSEVGQTQGNPNIAAWGDRLVPGMKAIAVSRDLIGMGLTHGTTVKIQGLPGVYVVRDKMNKRWKRRIDVYFGDDVEAALNWGRRKVRISW